jgi:hypothetical protein
MLITAAPFEKYSAPGCPAAGTLIRSAPLGSAPLQKNSAPGCPEAGTLISCAPFEKYCSAACGEI